MDPEPLSPTAGWNELRLGFLAPPPFRDFVKRYRDEMLASALRATRDPELAADVVQDALLRALREARSFDPDVHNRTWLQGLVRDSVLDRSSRVRPDQLPAEPEPVVPGHADDTAVRLDTERALSTLTSRQRDVVALVHMGGYSVAEAAEILGVSPRKVRSDSHDALLRLRAYFEQQLASGAATWAAAWARPADHDQAEREQRGDSDGLIGELRAELAGLTGSARLFPLTRLGQALAQRVWRAGFGSPEGRPDLDDAISALTEAYGYLRDDDSLRGNVASILGLLLSGRHSGYTNDERDCEQGIRMLEEALAWPGLSAPLRGISRIQLGQLLLNQVITAFQKPGAAMAMITGSAPAGLSDQIEKAADLFRQVVADPPTAEIAEAAETMLAMTDAVGTFGSERSGGLDLQQLMNVLTRMQSLRDRLSQDKGGFHGAGSVFGTAPMDRPVPVMDVPVEERTRRQLAELVRRDPEAFDASADRVTGALERLFIALGPPPDDLRADGPTRRGADG